MQKIHSSEVPKRWPAMLNGIVGGKSFIITADGREIAKVTPASPKGPVGNPMSPEQFARVEAGFRRLRAKYGGMMTVEELLECRDEGRKK